MIDKDLLSRFCSHDENRDALTQPWSEGEFSFASDGRMLVEVPRIAEIQENPRAPKNVRQNIIEATTPTNLSYQPVTDILIKTVANLSPVDNCPQCGGSGNCQCRDCRASHNCGRCEGSGQVTATFAHEGLAFKVVPLQQLIRLPKLEWSICPDKDPLNNTKIFFRFDGGRGILSVPRIVSED